MRWARLAVLALIGVLPALAVAAGKVWTPASGSDERKLVLNAARVPVEKDVGQPVVFRVEKLRVSSGWALVYGYPRRADGKPIDWSKTYYADRVKSGDFVGNAAVLLARDGAGWRVITYSIGFGDVVWDSWDEEFGAPAWLWP